MMTPPIEPLAFQVAGNDSALYVRGYPPTAFRGPGKEKAASHPQQETKDDGVKCWMTRSCPNICAAQIQAQRDAYSFQLELDRLLLSSSDLYGTKQVKRNAYCCDGPYKSIRMLCRHFPIILGVTQAGVNGVSHTTS
jgi:hypothetical protein